MKKTTKKLAFEATTLRNLQAAELERIAGAGSCASQAGDSRSTCSVSFAGTCMCGVTRECVTDLCDSINVCEPSVFC